MRERAASMRGDVGVEAVDRVDDLAELRVAQVRVDLGVVRDARRSRAGRTPRTSRGTPAWSASRSGRSSRSAGSSTWMIPMPAASRSAISSRRARATWRAVSPSGWSSRTKDHARIVTGPVSMPLTGLSVSDCAYVGPLHRDRRAAATRRPTGSTGGCSASRRTGPSRSAVTAKPSRCSAKYCTMSLRSGSPCTSTSSPSSSCSATTRAISAFIALVVRRVGRARPLAQRRARAADLGGLREGADRRRRQRRQVERRRPAPPARARRRTALKSARLRSARRSRTSARCTPGCSEPARRAQRSTPRSPRRRRPRPAARAVARG